MSKRAVRISAILTLSSLILGAPVCFGEDQPVKKEAPVAQKTEAPPATLTSSLPPAGTLDQSLANEVKAATVRGLDWLASKQNDDGSWSERNFPALTWAKVAERFIALINAQDWGEPCKVRRIPCMMIQL